jgi:tetratricopeptide (TPR) repeat protein
MAEIPKQKIAALEKKVGGGGKSPLFAQLAGYYVQAGRAQEALQLCDAGLAAFPHYTTGHFLKGKALLALKMNAEARREFEIVHEFLPANETVAFILSNIQPGEGESLTIPSAEPAAAQPPIAPTPEPEVAPPAAVEQVGTQEEVATETIAPATPEEPSAFALPAEPGVTETTAFETAAAPVAAEDPFGLVSGSRGETAPPAAPAVGEETVNPFEGFPGQPESAVSEVAPAPGEAEGETFESYAARMQGELEGENSMTLEQFLNPPQEQPPAAPEEPPAAPSDTIENLAEKLQTAKKITPVIDFSTKATIPTSEEDTPASTGFVTPTLAEIYAKQGWYDDAIKAYRMLVITKPAERERFEKRIVELEELKKQQS